MENVIFTGMFWWYYHDHGNKYNTIISFWNNAQNMHKNNFVMVLLEKLMLHNGILMKTNIISVIVSIRHCAFK